MVVNTSEYRIYFSGNFIRHLFTGPEVGTTRSKKVKSESLGHRIVFFTVTFSEGEGEVR